MHRQCFQPPRNVDRKLQLLVYVHMQLFRFRFSCCSQCLRERNLRVCQPNTHARMSERSHALSHTHTHTLTESHTHTHTHTHAQSAHTHTLHTHTCTEIHTHTQCGTYIISFNWIFLLQFLFLHQIVFFLVLFHFLSGNLSWNSKHKPQFMSHTNSQNSKTEHYSDEPKQNHS